MSDDDPSASGTISCPSANVSFRVDLVDQRSGGYFKGASGACGLRDFDVTSSTACSDLAFEVPSEVRYAADVSVLSGAFHLSLPTNSGSEIHNFSASRRMDLGYLAPGQWDLLVTNTGSAQARWAIHIHPVPFPEGGTTVTIFHAFNPDGTPTLPLRFKTGYCWTGSLTADRNDAWRCFVGNFIYDPCFSSPQAPGIVICPNPWLSGAIEIELTRGLPRAYGDTRKPSISGHPWNIQLANRHHCVFSSGASNFVAGKRLNYFCSGLSYGLWGYPNRRSEPWSIASGPFAATRLHGRSVIRQVWT